MNLKSSILNKHQLFLLYAAIVPGVLIEQQEAALDWQVVQNVQQGHSVMTLEEQPSVETVKLGSIAMKVLQRVLFHFHVHRILNFLR